jgi:hypothetical protein
MDDPPADDLTSLRSTPKHIRPNQLSFGIFDNERVIQREFYGQTYQLGVRFDY